MPVTAVWRLDLAGQRLVRHGRERELTSLLFRLLAQFVRHPSDVQTRRELLDAVWGDGFRGTERVVDRAIWELRRLIEPDPAHPRYLRTKRGQGYWYRPPRPRPRGPSRVGPTEDADDREDSRAGKT